MGLVCKTQHAYFSSVNQTHTRRGKYLAYIIAYCEHPRGSQSCPLNTGIVLRTKVCSAKKHGKKSSDLIEPYVRLMPSVRQILKISKFLNITVEPPCATTSHKRPPPISDNTSKTPRFFQSLSTMTTINKKL